MWSGKFCKATNYAERQIMPSDKLLGTTNYATEQFSPVIVCSGLEPETNLVGWQIIQSNKLYVTNYSIKAKLMRSDKLCGKTTNYLERIKHFKMRSDKLCGMTNYA